MANQTIDDPLENAQQLADQMESLPFIFRFEYENMSSYFCALMDPIITAYSQGLVPGECCFPMSSNALHLILCLAVTCKSCEA